jgi:hypothetical protein
MQIAALVSDTICRSARGGAFLALSTIRMQAGMFWDTDARREALMRDYRLVLDVFVSQ